MSGARNGGAVAALLGALLLVAGLVLGYSTLQRDGVGCGSAFGGATSAATISDYTSAYEGQSGTAAADCTAALSDRDGVAKAVAWPGGLLLALGVAVAAYGLVAGAAAEQAERRRRGV